MKCGLVIVLSVVVAGCGGGAEIQSAAPPAAPPAGASQAKKMDLPLVESVTAGPDQIVVAVAKADGSSLEASSMKSAWEAELSLGAFLEDEALIRKVSSLDKASKGVRVDAHGADGSLSVGNVRTVGNLPAGVRYRGVGDDASTKDQLSKILKKFKISPLEVSVVHPKDAAVIVVGSVDDPRDLAGKLRELQNALFGVPDNFEGYYLEVQSSGVPIVRISSALRTAVGSFWVEESLRPLLDEMHRA